jgi:mannose-6-phosphate isomerase-like protein (cupin superfamily)
MAPFNKDMVELATKNDFFQKEVYLDNNIQIVLMSIPAGEDIGMETHRADQSTYFVAGSGQAIVDDVKSKVGPNQLVVIPKGAEHNIINNGSGPLKLFSIYAPPAEPKGVAHKTKADAEAAEEGFVSRAVKRVKEAVGS